MKGQNRIKIMTPEGNELKRHYRLSGRRFPNAVEMVKTTFQDLLKPLTAIKAKVYDQTGVQVSLQQLPWMKIFLVVVGGIVLMYKDMRFNLDLSAPTGVGTTAIVGTDDDNNRVHPVAYKEENPKTSLVPIGFDKDDVAQYVGRFKETAVSEMHKYGIPASIKMAQGLLESNCGKSSLASKNNNHFGIKCFSKNCKKGHCSNHSDDSHKDFFRNYGSSWESWRAHSNFLVNGRYKELLKYDNDYKAWAVGLSELGYATDKRYANKLISIIEKYKLYSLDRQ